MFKKILKYTGIGVLALLILLLIGYVFIYIHTEGRIGKEYKYLDKVLVISTDSASVSRGEHLYNIRGCADCHGDNLAGGTFMNDPLLLQITAPNLTKGKGGLPKNFNVNDWVRAIRHGVNEYGHSLFMMPSQELYKLTDEDLAAIIAYCESVAPVNTSYEKMRSIGPVGRLLMAMDNVTILPAEKIDHRAVPASKREEKYDAAQGEYLATSCVGCHRSDMQGGGPLAPGFPQVPDITSQGNLGNWSVGEFISSIKTGKTPEGKALDNQYMPWQSISRFTDEELTAIYLYLQGLPVEHR